MNKYFFMAGKLFLIILSLMLILTNLEKLYAASASVFLNQIPAEPAAVSGGIYTIPNDPNFPIEYYVTVGATSYKPVIYEIIGHDGTGLTNSTLIISGVCNVNETIGTPYFEGNLNPVLANKDTANISLKGTEPSPIFSQTKYIAGVVIYTPFDMQRKGQSAESLKEYVDTQVAQMDAENRNQN